MSGKERESERERDNDKKRIIKHFIVKNWILLDKSNSKPRLYSLVTKISILNRAKNDFVTKKPFCTHQSFQFDKIL